MTKKERLVELYREMADLTEGDCGKSCGIKVSLPYRCCSGEYCKMAMEIASEEWGVTLEPTGHAFLPLMGPNGCTAEPHFRPNCTLHYCQINSLGFKVGDTDFNKKYFDLREKISLLELLLTVDGPLS